MSIQEIKPTTSLLQTDDWAQCERRANHSPSKYCNNLTTTADKS